MPLEEWHMVKNRTNNGKNSNEIDKKRTIIKQKSNKECNKK